MRTAANGFTLIELAVVLVIIGLLAGGVLVGSSLLRGGELRSIAADVTRYTAAIQNFRNKYSTLPGDLKTAYSFWGVAAGCTNAVPAAAGDTGCNGNGDGKISTWYTEGKRAWWMLQQSGYLEGNVGAGAIAKSATPGTDVPASKIGGGGAGYTLLTAQYASSPMGWGSYGDYATWIMLGTAAAVDPTINSALKPEDALNLDTKMDDGMPGTGQVLGGDGYTGAVYASACVTARTSAGTYDTTKTTITCTMGFEVP